MFQRVHSGTCLPTLCSGTCLPTNCVQWHMSPNRVQWHMSPNQLCAVAHVSQPTVCSGTCLPTVCSGLPTTVSPNQLCAVARLPTNCVQWHMSPNQLCAVAHVSQPAGALCFSFIYMCVVATISLHYSITQFVTNALTRLLPGVEHAVLTPDILTCTFAHSLAPSKVGMWQVGVAPGQTSLCPVHSSQLPAVHAAD